MSFFKKNILAMNGSSDPLYQDMLEKINALEA